MLKLTDIYTLQLGVFVYKSLNSLLPMSCSVHVKKHEVFHSYPLRKEYGTVAPAYKTKIRECYVGVSGPKLWNALPEQVISSPSVSMFKKSLKEFLIANY